MRRPSRASVALLLFLLASWRGSVAPAQVGSSESPPELVRVRATGQAPIELRNARDAAIEHALRRAVEAAGGLEIVAVSRTEDYQLAADVIVARSAGYVQRYEVLEENPNQGGLYAVRVAAVVRRGAFNNDLESLRTILKRKGRPLVMVAGRTGSAAADRDAEAALQKILTDRGTRVVDLAVLDQAKQREARLADRDERNLRKAAAIADEVRANVLALVTLDMEAAVPKEQYGISSFVTQGSLTIRLVDPKTAVVFAVEPLETRGQGSSPESALRAAIAEGIRLSADRALLRIGQHWLEELDGRGGAEIALVLHGMDFNEVEQLADRLQSIDGVKEVLIDSTDAKGVSRMRVITNATAANLASALSKLDRSLVVRAMTPTTIELGR